MTKTPAPWLILLLLGCLSVLTPFAIDMYLPAYVQVAQEFGVATPIISLTLSSYFIGMALGQVFYGPLLDRFGRKRPLGCGLLLFIAASIGCGLTQNVYALIALRFIQSLGGCATQVASTAMVRDFFPAKDTARILSSLFLFIAVSPLFAPTIGGLVIALAGWRAVFFVLAGVAALILALIWALLPEAHAPDKGISLKPLPILREYARIFGCARFAVYALAGAFSFAGLFTYVAGSPIIFMEGFHLSPRSYSMVFGALAIGFIGASQVNVLLLRRFNSAQLFSTTLLVQCLANAVFLGGALSFGWGLPATLVLFFIVLSCVGITYPNAAGLAMAPFTRHAGSAAALLGFMQLGVGALISAGISLSGGHASLPIIAILAITSWVGLLIWRGGAKAAAKVPAID